MPIYCINRGLIRPWDLKGSIRDVVYGPCCGKSLFPHGSKRKRKYPPSPSPKLVFILSKREYGTHRLFPKGCLGEFACRARIKRRKDIPPPSSSFSSHITVLAIPVGGIKANYTLLYIFLVCAPRTHIPPQIPTKKLPHCTKKRDRLRWGKGEGDKQLFLGSSSRDGKTISLSPSTPSKKQAIGSPPTHYYYVISKSHRKKG